MEKKKQRKHPKETTPRKKIRKEASKVYPSRRLPFFFYRNVMRNRNEMSPKRIRF